MAIGIISVFLLVFIPQFKTNFGRMGDSLPSITRFVINFSEWFQASAFWIFGALALVVIAILHFVRTPRGRCFLDRARLGLPAVGTLVRKVVLVRVTRTLGTLLGNGVPIIEALTIVAAASGNMIMEDLLNQTRKKIADGQRMADTLKASPLIPQMVLQMIAMGEETGHLPEMLLKSAEYYDSDVDVAVERLTAVITPIMIITLGLFVGLIVVALFLPMFNMSSLAV
jgi:type IV pilus assembly protein PilC